MLAMLMLTGCAQAALCVRMDDAAALLDRSGGEIVVPGTYADIVPLGGGLYAACDATGRYGLMDESGEVRTDFLYDQLRWADGLLLFHFSNDAVGDFCVDIHCAFSFTCGSKPNVVEWSCSLNY